MRTNPGEVTRIIVRFEGYTGKYVYHCHILEHEDHDMMRAYVVVPPGAAPMAGHGSMPRPGAGRGPAGGGMAGG